MSSSAKGFTHLLEALLILHPSRAAFILDIVGSLTTDPNYAKQMQEFVTVNGLSSIVHFHGALDNEPLKQKLRQAHMSDRPIKL